MGSVSRMEKCGRFLAEFNETAREKFKIDHPDVVEWSLGQNSNDDCVYMFYTLKAKDEEEYELVLPYPKLYDPENTDTETIETVQEALDIPISEAAARLKKAELIR